MSTDFIEYLNRKKLPLVLYRFRELANLDIESLHQLVNEWFFPRSDCYRDCAGHILNFFPATWSNLLQERQDLDTEVKYQKFFLIIIGNLLKLPKSPLKELELF